MNMPDVIFAARDNMAGGNLWSEKESPGDTKYVRADQPPKWDGVTRVEDLKRGEYAFVWTGLGWEIEWIDDKVMQHPYDPAILIRWPERLEVDE